MIFNIDENNFLESDEIESLFIEEGEDWTDSNDKDVESGWETSDDDVDDSFSEFVDLTEADNEFIKSEYFDDKIEPTTIMPHDAEKSQYDSVDDAEVIDSEDGTTTVEIESFTGWDDLF